MTTTAVGAFALLVTIGPPVVLGTFVKIGRRPRGLLARIWSWYGYRAGLYWVSWRVQAFRRFRNGTRRRCSCGRWSSHDGVHWKGLRCAKPEIHIGKCRMVADSTYGVAHVAQLEEAPR